MTVRIYHEIIGNAWGKPKGQAGPEHYYRYDPARRGFWRSACGEQEIVSTDIFRGVGRTSLTFENNPLHQEHCEPCVEFYMRTWYGQEFGIQSPGWTPAHGQIYHGEELL
jgi:hypothetical protein